LPAIRPRPSFELPGAMPRDLLVVGSRGLTGVKAAALGSVSQAVAQLAPCPVLIVKA
jgi:hypothetical protein